MLDYRSIVHFYSSIYLFLTAVTLVMVTWLQICLHFSVVSGVNTSYTQMAVTVGQQFKK